MAWHITGTVLGPCSCDIGCPCILGVTEGDRGWCSAVKLYDVHSGEVDGIDVSGTRVAFAADWPSGFLAGNGTGTRLLHGAATFRDDLILADGRGTRFHDPELGRWESGGHGERIDFDWSA